MLIFSSVGHRDKHRIQNPAGGSSLFPDLRLKQGKGNSCQLSKLFKVVLLALAEVCPERAMPYFLRVTQSSKETLNCMIQKLFCLKTWDLP